MGKQMIDNQFKSVQDAVVITYMDKNYEENLYYDFLPTFRLKAGLGCEIIVLDYGMSDSAVEKVKAFDNVTIVKCLNDASVFTVRYRDIANMLLNMDGNVNIIVMDSADIWFQDSIADMVNKKYSKDERQYISCVRENRIFGDDEWIDKCMANLSQDMYSSVTEAVNGNYVNNSGVIVGKAKSLSSIFQAVYKDICDNGYEFFGIDQIMLNYELYSSRNHDVVRCELPDEYNYVLVSHKNEYFVDEKEVVRRKDGRIINVVHNAGGNWRELTRPFKNKYCNSEQYVIENLYKLK